MRVSRIQAHFHSEGAAVRRDVSSSLHRPRRRGRSAVGSHGVAAKRKQLAGVHILQAPVGCFGRFNQFRVGPVRDIDKSYVVVFAVHAAEHGFVAPLKPVGANKPRERRGLLDVIAVSDAPLGLIFGLYQPSCKSVCGYANMELADKNGAAGETGGTNELFGRLVLIYIDAAGVENMGGGSFLGPPSVPGTRCRYEKV